MGWLQFPEFSPNSPRIPMCLFGGFSFGKGFEVDCPKALAELRACTPPPPLAHAPPCLSTGGALNRCFEEILGPLFLWSRMEDWVFVEQLYRERGAQSCL